MYILPDQSKIINITNINKGVYFWLIWLTDSELEVVKRMFVDLLNALIQSEGEICQRTQMPPLVFALLWEHTHIQRLVPKVTCFYILNKYDPNNAIMICFRAWTGIWCHTCFSGDNPDTAMYVLPMVFIFSMSWNLSSPSSCERREMRGDL